MAGSEYTRVLNDHVNFNTVAYNSRTGIFLYMRLHLITRLRTARHKMWLRLNVRLHGRYYNIRLHVLTLAEGPIQRWSWLYFGTFVLVLALHCYCGLCSKLLFKKEQQYAC